MQTWLSQAVQVDQGWITHRHTVTVTHYWETRVTASASSLCVDWLLEVNETSYERNTPRKRWERVKMDLDRHGEEDSRSKTLVRLPKKSNRRRIETILRNVLKFQIDRACFQRGETSADTTRRDVQSLATFRQQLKIVMFRTSFGEDADTWAVSLSTCDCFVFVRWPCNVFMICHRKH